MERLLGVAIDFAGSESDHSEIQELVVNIIEPNDPRGTEDVCIDAKKVEVDGLMKRNIWKKVKKSDVPVGAIMLGGRFVMSLKNYMVLSEAAKAWYVAQGYNAIDKKFIVHDTDILRISSIRIILSSGSFLVFRLFSHDVTQVYSQIKDKLTRKIFIQPNPLDLEIFCISINELIELIRPLYGFATLVITGV